MNALLNSADETAIVIVDFVFAGTFFFTKCYSTADVLRRCWGHCPHGTEEKAQLRGDFRSRTHFPSFFILSFPNFFCVFASQRHWAIAEYGGGEEEKEGGGDKLLGGRCNKTARLLSCARSQMSFFKVEKIVYYGSAKFN